MTDDTGNSFELSLVGCKCIGAYVRNKKNQNQVIKLAFHFLRVANVITNFFFTQLTDKICV